MKGHEILWQDDGMIGYRCYDDAPGVHTGSVSGLDEGDRVVTCPTCGVRLKASWDVRLDETQESETPE